MKEILVDRGKLIRKDSIELLNDPRIAFHRDLLLASENEADFDT
jgi:hypothetical protein